MRGAQVRYPCDALTARIIPAYAGSTPQVAGDLLNRRDHPRVCGEHYTVATIFIILMGSSPRMRGAPGILEVDFEQLGIIPAYAGSTDPRLMACGRSPDHPRVCGEHRVDAIRQRLPSGSSPRMRGARNGRGGSRFNLGIIPAYAGSTRSATA